MPIYYFVSTTLENKADPWNATRKILSRAVTEKQNVTLQNDAWFLVAVSTLLVYPKHDVLSLKSIFLPFILPPGCCNDL